MKKLTIIILLVLLFHYDAVAQDTSYVRFPVAVRTNLLLPLMNVGVEMPVARHSSIGVDWYYPWIWPQWLGSSNSRCIETLALSLEYRFWFSGAAQSNGKSDLSGLSLGIEAAAGYYDWQWNWSGNQGEFILLGLDVSYAVLVDRGRMRIEFSAGMGYGYLQKREYKVYEEGGELLRPASLPVLTGFLPMPSRLGVSLVIPIWKK